MQFVGGAEKQLIFSDDCDVTLTLSTQCGCMNLLLRLSLFIHLLLVCLGVDDSGDLFLGFTLVLYVGKELGKCCGWLGSQSPHSKLLCLLLGLFRESPYLDLQRLHLDRRGRTKQTSS